MVLGEIKTKQPQPSPETCADLFDQGEQFTALHDWFQLDDDIRSEAIEVAITTAVKYDVEPYTIRTVSNKAQDEGLTLTDAWVINNLALLSSPTIDKLFKLDSGTVDPSELEPQLFDGLSSDNQRAQQHFIQIQDRFIEESDEAVENYLMPDVDDLNSSSKSLSQISFSEMSRLLSYLTDYLPEDHCAFRDKRESKDLDDDGVFFKLVSEANHFDLLSDDELLGKIPRLENLLIAGAQTTLILGDILSAGRFYKASSLARYVNSGYWEHDTDWADDSSDNRAPIGAYFHAVLQRSVHSLAGEWHDPDTVRYRTEAVADYLIDDTLMNRYIPYLRLGKAWDNKAVTGDLEASIVAEGWDAVERKLIELSEVVTSVYNGLISQGDIEKAELLKNRTVQDIKLADLIQ